MMKYEECKKIAEEIADKYNVTIDKAYNIGNDFAFDTNEEYEGVFPLVVCANDGFAMGIWQYVNDKDMSMDDMIEREL